MVRYLSLISFTDRGIKDVSQSLDRATKFRGEVEALGGKVICQYWALGEFDGALVFECPDDKAAASLMLKLGQADNVRTRTTRLFDAVEFGDIVSGVG